MRMWKEIALPALQAIRELQGGDSAFGVTDKDIARKLGKPLSEVGHQLLALRDDNYIVIGKECPNTADPFGFRLIRLAPRGLRTLGDWPSEEIEELFSALNSALEAAKTPDDRGNLKKLIAKIAEVMARTGVSEVVDKLIKMVT